MLVLDDNEVKLLRALLQSLDDQDDLSEDVHDGAVAKILEREPLDEDDPGWNSVSDDLDSVLQRIHEYSA